MRLASIGVVAWLLVLSSGGPVSAHGELTLQLGTERIQPGGAIEVRGDLGSGESFEVALISMDDGSRRAIATIPAIEEGHFQSYVTIPPDISTGGYLVEVAAGVAVAQAPLTVAGSPVDDAGGRVPGQDEGLIQPVPSGFGAGTGVGAGADNASIGPGASSATGDTTQPATTPGRSRLDGLVVMAIAVLVAVSTLGGLRRAGRRRSGHVNGRGLG
jgi:hypothetical protein